MTRRTKTILWISVALLALLQGPSLANFVGNAKAFAAKSGSVIDVATGKGMPNVAVIAVATFAARASAHGGIHDTLYRIITHTDTNGEYRIPAAWGNSVFWFPPLPGTEPHVEWRVTAFQPGYAIEGDEVAWSEFDKHGYPKILPPSTNVSPSSNWRGTSVSIVPIRMHAANLSLKESALYYRELTVGGAGPDQRAPEELRLREPGYRVLLQALCSENPDTELDYTTLTGLTAFASDAAKFVDLGRAFKPDAWPTEMYKNPKYHAGEVCEAMRQVGGFQ